MTPEAWQQVKAVFDTAVTLPPDERAPYLDRACGANSALRNEVESLLAAADSPAGFLRSDPHPATTPPENEHSIIAPGQSIGRYRVLAQLGWGGMGEVYVAEDPRLRRRVALKLLPRELSHDAERLHRFEQEARAASQLAHSNVCVVHEIGDTTEGRPFIAMEYIEGQSLRQLLERHRTAGTRMTLDEALDVALQVAAGLEAAHAEGIVHRDVKPENVMRRPDGLVKVLDFGVAKLMKPGVPGSGMLGEPSLSTEPGVVMGTVQYMSPEHARGLEVDARTDVWSLGVVLYEMLAGYPPFEGKSNADVVASILDREPPLLTEVAPEPLEEVQRIVGRALAKDREARYPTMREFDSELALLRKGSAEQETKPRTRRVIVFRYASVTTVAIAVASLLYLRRTPTPRPELRPAVAVIGFRNLSGRADADWLSGALSEELATELAAGERLRMIPGEEVSLMKQDLAVAEAESYGSATLTRIRKRVGADIVVVGSYVDLAKDASGRIRLDLRLQDTRSGRTVASLSTFGTETALFDLVSTTGARLREALGVAGVAGADLASLGAALPSSRQAAQFYSEGLANLRLFDALAARDLLKEAVAAESTLAPAHAALADAWAMLGYSRSAQQEAKVAFALSSGLPREQRLVMEARYHAAVHEWDKAIEIYRTLFGYFPDNLDYGLRLADAQHSVGRGKEALNTVQALRGLPAPLRDDPRIDLAEVQAAGAVGDFNRQAAAAERAVSKAQAQGARLVLADALRWHAAALQNLGELTRAAAMATILQQSRRTRRYCSRRRACIGFATFLGSASCTSDSPIRQSPSTSGCCESRLSMHRFTPTPRTLTAWRSASTKRSGSFAPPCVSEVTRRSSMGSRSSR